jgi:type IV secretory pathway VirB10-like protein
MKRFCQTVIFAILLGAAPAWAQVYKCVDASGKVVYLQSPCPPGQSSKVISSTPPAEPKPPAPAAPGAKAPLTPEQAFQKRQKDQQEAAKKQADEAADAQKKQEACQRAREQVTRFGVGGRIAAVDSKGERYFLDDAQIAQEKAKAEASVNEWCK